MNQTYPIFTADAKCQDCFKCVRSCPIKAIKVEGHHASVISELCVACGRCVEMCPAKAKKIRDDLGRTKQLLSRGQPVYVSLAPSWVSEFRGLPAAKMIAALKSLGFAGVSETAIGAEIVNRELAHFMEDKATKLVISSACPVAVDFIRKYIPAFTGCISPVLSPMLAHAKWLQQQFSTTTTTATTAAVEKPKVVFIGPCIAKKNEADGHPDIIATALLYPDLKHWFAEAQVDPWKMDTNGNDTFVLTTANEGTLYPIEGGMCDTLRKFDNIKHINFVTISGLYSLRQMLEGFSPRDIREPIFLETLACVGGCVHGPGTTHGASGLLERLRIVRNSRIPDSPSQHENTDIHTEYTDAAVKEEPRNLQQIRQTLRIVGKHGPEDELNCGGCGYTSCIHFAMALIAGRAEPSMCVSHLRQLSQKKSNAILRCIPAAVVIVDSTLHLIECNRRFAELSGEDTVAIFEAVPGMAGSSLQKMVPFTYLFEEVLRTGKELNHDMIRMNERVLSVNLFNIEPGQVVGAILFDVTGIEFRREQISARAKEVIHKNLSTVQDIACMLGEHMAETEMLLRSIAEDYADKS